MGMNLFVHKDYEEYVNAQRAHTEGETFSGTAIKAWASVDMLARVNGLLHSYVDVIHAIVCHGCRSGFEVSVLQGLNPQARVYGTDIYDRAYKPRYGGDCFRNIDFDVVPEEWRGYFDVVYSNSIDHSRDPVNTLASWKSELTDSGICFVTFQFTRRQVNEVDCFNLSVDGYKDEIKVIADRAGMEMLYCSEPATINRWRGRYVDVVLR